MSTFSVILIALAMLAVGIAIGAFLWRKLGPTSHQSRELEEKLKAAEQRLSNYQIEVAEHFVETSRRVNELTRNYKEVHEYLANSAIKLTTPALGQDTQAARINWPEENETEKPAQPDSDVSQQNVEPDMTGKDSQKE